MLARRLRRSYALIQKRLLIKHQTIKRFLFHLKQDFFFIKNKISFSSKTFPKQQESPVLLGHIQDPLPDNTSTPLCDVITSHREHKLSVSVVKGQLLLPHNMVASASVQTVLASSISLKDFYRQIVNQVFRIHIFLGRNTW